MAELIAGRFRLERKVGGGGMGTVHRAVDELTGGIVALKLMHAEVPHGRERLTREAAALAKLSHPGIVGYVAHGPSFIAMEWIDGDDLSAHLRRAPLAIDDAITLTSCVAEALAHAHGLGVIHRDLKPSNIVLQNGDLSRPRLVDFGLAWIAGDEVFLTAAGTLLGTPGYMAPEQIRQLGVDARSDVFALACVLYCCLTGRGPFGGGDALATLAKVLFDDPAPASSLREGIPPLLDTILARALSKQPARRPASALELAAALAAVKLEPLAPGAAVPPTSSRVLTDRELRVVSVVVAARMSLGGDDETLGEEREVEFEGREAALRAAADRHGARLELVPGALMAVIVGQGAATDQAAAVARLALDFRRILPSVPIAIATGRAEVGQRSVGEVVERAMSRVGSDALPTIRSGSLSTSPAVWIDDTTAGLLGPTFVVQEGAAGLELVTERAADLQVRTLLGKPTPCVGRERELSFLDATLAECAEDSIARVVLLTGAPGVGKSRLRYEWTRRLGERGLSPWICRADPMSAGAPFSLLAQLVGRVAAVDPAEPETSRARLLERVGRLVHDEGERQRIAEFLGEMVGLRFAEEGRVQLRAARRDAMLMGDQIRRACEDWLGAEARHAPLVIVLEDLHWGDLPSVQLVDHVIATHANLPILIIALARPEVRDTFPNLWQARGPLELHLSDLSPKAAARLARHVLGDDVPDAVVERAVTRAAGNAFFLEEILRAIAEGAGDDVPATVLAMVERRLESLEPEARRVLRAASVFGETFWRSAILDQLGDVAETLSDGWLPKLAQRELVTLRAKSRFADEVECTFRHALVRDAAYAMLTDEDRVLAHRLAGAWLEAHGERDAAALAQHFDRGGESERAIGHYVRAAAQALEGNDLAQVVSRAERGVALGARGEALGELRRLQAEAMRWRGSIAEAEAAAREAVSLLQPGSPPWCLSLGELVASAGVMARVDVIRFALDTLLAQKQATPKADYLATLSRIVTQLYMAGQSALANANVVELDAYEPELGPSAGARVAQTRSFAALYSSDTGTYYEHLKSAQRLFELSGDRRAASVQALNMGYVAVACGAIDEAEAVLVPALRTADALGVTRIRACVQQNLGLLRRLQGRLDESVELLRRAQATFSAQGDRRLSTFSLVYLADALDARGETDAAFAEAERAVEVSEVLPPAHAVALATLAKLELAHGRGDPLEHSTPAYSTLEQLGGLEDSDAMVRVVHAEVLERAGRIPEAVEVTRRAVEALHSRASKISSERWRKTFLETEDGRRTFALARALGVPTEPG